MGQETTECINNDEIRSMIKINTLGIFRLIFFSKGLWESVREEMATVKLGTVKKWGINSMIGYIYVLHKRGVIKWN